MQHRPFFRWVVTLAVVLVACSAVAYALTPGHRDTMQIDLTVVDEKPDGTCTVRWEDPFRDDGTRREAAYLRDPDRDPHLKAPAYDEVTGYGWESGFVYVDGPDKGDLEPSARDQDPGDSPYALSDTLVIVGLPLLAIGLVGGNVRAAGRALGVRPKLVARAQRLCDEAESVTRDHARAVEAVREAWAALGVGQADVPTALASVARRGAHERDRRTVALLVSLRVVLEAGPATARVVRRAEQLAATLRPLLWAAEPATGYRRMLAAGPQRRLAAAAAVAELRLVLDAAQEDHLPEQFAQASVDLLRAPDDAVMDGLAATTDFESREKQYVELLSSLVGRARPAGGLRERRPRRSMPGA
ncbi:hypothetical protein ACTWJ8_36465 [Streptomyces sp. SDT5-1]|uniref:hypothetical protein n=1 Tax=Streptomyces sp. SDT5-1 TaxID=3406418 RepID=UPI003FD37B62